MPSGLNGRLGQRPSAGFMSGLAPAEGMVDLAFVMAESWRRHYNHATTLRLGDWGRETGADLREVPAERCWSSGVDSCGSCLNLRRH